MIRHVTLEDARSLCAIYNHYVENTIITFEEQLVSTEEMRQRIQDITRTLPWFVLEQQGEVVGFAYANPWKGRCAYRFTAEITIYLATHQTGQGKGFVLYQSLLQELRNRSFHSVMGGVSLPNPASVALHEKLGFQKVAHFKEVGWKFQRWIDVGYWQLQL